MRNTERRIMMEHADYNLGVVPSLKSICANKIVFEFKDSPGLHGIPEKHWAWVLARVCLDTPLSGVLRSVHQDEYWRRRTARDFGAPAVSREPGKPHLHAYAEHAARKHIHEFVPGVSSELELSRSLREISGFVQKLNISQLHAHDAAAHHLDPLVLVSCLPGLRELSVYYGLRNVGMQFAWAQFGMTPRDAEMMCAALKSARWESLCMPGCRVTDALCVTLCAGLRQHPTMRILDLSSNLLGDTAAQSLASLTNTLDALKLGTNQIGTLGAAHIARALATEPPKSGQTSLDLQLNPLGNEGGAVLSRALQASGLVALDLNLSSTGIGQTALECLSDLIASNSVVNLDLSCNRFADGKFLRRRSSSSIITGAGETDVRVLETEALSSREAGVIDRIALNLLTSVSSSSRLKSLDLRATDLPPTTIIQISNFVKQTFI